MFFVTGNLCECSGGLLCGGQVLDECQILIVDKCEESTSNFEEWLHGGSSSRESLRAWWRA